MSDISGNNEMHFLISMTCGFWSMTCISLMMTCMFLVDYLNFFRRKLALFWLMISICLVDGFHFLVDDYNGLAEV